MVKPVVGYRVTSVGDIEVASPTKWLQLIHEPTGVLIVIHCASTTKATFVRSIKLLLILVSPAETGLVEALGLGDLQYSPI